MANKQTAHVIKGLRRDFSDSKQPAEYAIDAKNIRIVNREDSTLLSITNEKGTESLLDLYNDRNTRYNITCINVTVINNNIICFFAGTKTYQNTTNTTINDIIKIHKKDNEWVSTPLYEGTNTANSLLGLTKDSKIQTLVSYESEEIQKVYWVDGVHQPRVINIAATEEERSNWNSKSFDFLQEVQLKETITVTKEYGSGSFSPGVIQYAFSYFNKNGQETNIIDVTPLNYISYEDRGAAANDYVSNNFRIVIANQDTNFDYLRLYSIHRTSLDAIPSVKLVTDIAIKPSNEGPIDIIDTGTIGANIDPAELLYKGGDYIIPKTLVQKDGTLFFGNIKLKENTIINEDTIESWRTTEDITWKPNKGYNPVTLSGYYPYTSNLNRQAIAGFKAGETYRLGIQFQDKSGKWSDPIFYNDKPVNTNPTSSIDGSTIYYNTIKGRLQLTEDLITEAINKDYVKVRPLVVYPQDSERNIIAQGVLSPTIFNAKDRQNGTCFSQSSWFFRPFAGLEINDKLDGLASNDKVDEDNIPEYGSWTEFRHYYSLPSSYERNAEIQSNLKLQSVEDYEGIKIDNRQALYQTSYQSGTVTIDDSKALNILNYSSNIFSDSFFIDQSILTFHSPEIELGYVTNIDNYKLRIVGYSTFDTNAGDISIMTENAAFNPNIAQYYISSYKGVEYDYSNKQILRSLNSGLFYKDGGALTVGTSLIYPWQSKTTINAFITKEYKDKNAKLKTKKISNLKYSAVTTYINPIDIESSINIFTEEESIFLDKPDGLNTLDNKDSFVYKGNIDTAYLSSINDEDFYIWDRVLPNGDNDFIKSNSASYKLNLKYGRPKAGVGDSNDYIIPFNENISLIVGENAPPYYLTDPIPIKYKSTPHAIISLGYDSTGKQYILPDLHNNRSNFNSALYTYGNIKANGFESINLDVDPIDQAFLWVAELYRDPVPNKFGGDNYENNLWYPAGDSVYLFDDEGNLKSNVYVEFTQGDTFFARFDSLKTYSDNLDAPNSVTEIGSFMLETRVNLDARYDRNRGKKSNLVMNPRNFNLFNDVYNQKDNFFNYRIIDRDIADNTNFPNTIVWSKQKLLNSEIDAWTNINMASSIDLNGEKGELVKLETFNNEVYAFQPEAISHILFNSRVQVPASDGLPIEITNSYKVEGYRQLFNIGSSHPKTIKSTPYGIYYMDNITKGIYMFNGQNNVSITDKLGMNSWIKKQNIDLYSTYYDKVNQDVYFSGNECLCYSEKLGEFESFFDYDNAEIFNVGEDTLAIAYSFSEGSLKPSYSLNKLFSGEYNNILGNKYPFWITITHNENPFNDKIYNTLEFRADTWDGDTLSETSAFDTIQVKNEYQDTGNVALNFNKYIPSNLKRKFRIWRANIPRDSTHKRDRIRNTWTNITLKASSPNTTKTELHDLTVNYFM